MKINIINCFYVQERKAKCFFKILFIKLMMTRSENSIYFTPDEKQQQIIDFLNNRMAACVQRACSD